MSHDVEVPNLILASSSVYRQQMLKRLMLNFRAVSPNVDETPLPNEAPATLAQRLARSKASAVARAAGPCAVVIGADQVLEHKGQSLGKPGGRVAARHQLLQLRGQSVTFHSAMAVLTCDSEQLSVSICHATFRDLSETQIDRYLDLETPFDTAGSAKAEGLGIALMSSLQSNDPTAIIGLPLIELTRMLTVAGLDPLDFAQPPTSEARP